MKLILLLILFSVQLCMAQDVPGKLQLSLASGYGQQNLRWSIAGNANGQELNVLSELKWKNVGGPVTAGNIRWNFFGGWLLEGEYAHMFFSSGKADDTDYGGNDRTNAMYAAQFHAGKGGANSWRAGAGYQIPVTRSFSIIPSAGYGMFHQSFYIFGFNDLNSTYKTKWAGPYGQVLCSAALTKKLSVNAGFRYSQVHYRASANWNLIAAFAHPESFRHRANGYGINTQASLLYRVSHVHSIGIKGSYFNWQTGRGVDELYLAAGGMQQTQLNGVRSAGWQVMAEWKISF